MFPIKRLVFKLTFFYALFMVLLLGSIFIFFSTNYSKFIFREKESVYEQKLDLVTEEFSKDIERMFTLHSEALSTPCLQELIKGNISAGEETGQALEALRRKYLGVSSIYLYSKEGDLLESAANSLEAPPVFRELPDFRSSKAYRHFDLQEEGMVYYGAFFLNQDKRFTYEAYLTIVINPSRLFYNAGNLARGTFSGLYLLDSRQEELVMQEGEAFSEALLLKSGQASRIRNENSDFIFFKNSCRSYPEWTLAATVDYTAYGQEVWRLTLLLLSLAVLSMGLIILISFFISRRIIRPITQVSQAMVQVEQGEYPAPLVSHSADETDDLIQGFNHMVDSLRKLNADILQEQEEKRRYEVEQVKSRLQLLQSQVNPHFIHNTLNTLKYMALTEGNKELAGTITSFNALLRASISTDMEYTTMEEECHYIMEYMNIQQKRCTPGQVHCTAHVTPEASQGLLPRLILQPLVENSLFHGILPLEGKPGHIRIHGFVEDAFLHIYISDDGIGIPEETLEKLNCGELRVTSETPLPDQAQQSQSHTPSRMRSGYNHVGLNNVKDRLKLMYRSDCKFIITSEYHHGTTIYLCVPYEEEHI